MNTPQPLFNLRVRPICYDGELGRLLWITLNESNNLREGTIYAQQKDAAKLTQTEVDNFVQQYGTYYRIEEILKCA